MTDASVLVYKTAQRELVSICTREYATAINLPCIITLIFRERKKNNKKILSTLYNTFTSFSSNKKI